MGWLASSRPSRTEWLEEGSARQGLLARAAAFLEDLERATYDWRAEQLGRFAERSDAVVPVVIDQETLANARADATSPLALEPWSRVTLARLVDEALREGAEQVIIDLPVSGASPHRGPEGGDGPLADEEAALTLLRAHPGRIWLPVRGSLQRNLPPPGRPGPAFLAILGRPDSRDALHEQVRRLLSRGERVYVLPEEGGELLAVGSRTREGAERLQTLGGSTGAPELRPFLPAHRAHEVDALGLLLRLAAVEVEGISAASLLQLRSLEPPLVPLLAPELGYGVVSLIPDPDGRFRAMAHLVAVRDGQGQRHILPSLPLAAVMAREGASTLRYRDGYLEIGESMRIPMEPNGYSYLQWDGAEVDRDPRGTLAREINAWRLVSNFQDLEQGNPPRHRNRLEGHSVVLTRLGTGRGVQTPVGALSSAGLVEGQAMVDLLRSGGIRRVDPRTDLLLTVGLGFFGALLALASSRAVKSRSGVWAYLLGALALAALHFGIARHLFTEERVWIAVAGPLLAMGATFLLTTLYALRTEREFADLVSGTLGRYASADVLRRVLRDVSLLKPERRPMTVFFSDLEGFTASSEKLRPEEVVELLNDYFTEMSRLVREHGGQVDKFMGDGLMAFWGAPVRTPRHALLACEAALAMRAAVSARQEEWFERFGTRISVRAGLHSGEVLVGDMGTAAKSAYTVLGPVVNLAAKLEQSARRMGCDLLVGEKTASLAGPEFVYREVLRLQNGKDAPVRVLELMGRKGHLPERMSAMLEAWDNAWTAWLAGDFGIAQAAFERCVREYGDAPAQRYVQACERLRRLPVSDSWDGVLDERAG